MSGSSSTFKMTYLKKKKKITEDNTAVTLFAMKTRLVFCNLTVYTQLRPDTSLRCGSSHMLSKPFLLKSRHIQDSKHLITFHHNLGLTRNKCSSLQELAGRKILATWELQLQRIFWQEKNLSWSSSKLKLCSSVAFEFPLNTQVKSYLCSVYGTLSSVCLALTNLPVK